MLSLRLPPTKIQLSVAKVWLPMLLTTIWMVFKWSTWTILPSTKAWPSNGWLLSQWPSEIYYLSTLSPTLSKIFTSIILDMPKEGIRESYYKSEILLIITPSCTMVISTLISILTNNFSSILVHKYHNLQSQNSLIEDLNSTKLWLLNLSDCMMLKAQAMSTRPYSDQSF